MARSPGFPAPDDGRVVVVGAGTAGCVVAGRLARAGYGVDLLDAGTSEFPASDPRLASVDHLEAHRAPHRWWGQLEVFRGAGGRGERPVPYLAGRGLGGSSAVNGLLADIRLDDPALGPPDEVAAALDRCLLPIERPQPHELGAIDRALLAVPGARPLDLHRSQGGRADIAAAYLHGDHDVRVVGDALVDGLVDGSLGVVVVTAAGDRFEASAVVVCAGTLHTPGILRRSGIGREVGRGVQGHPAVSIPVVRRSPVSRSMIVTGAALDHGPVQLVALDHVSTEPVPAGEPDAALLVALMRPVGAAGTVDIAADDPALEPTVYLRSFDEPADLAALRSGVRWALDLVAAAPLADVIEGVAASHNGRSLVELDDDELDDWIRAEPGAHAHAVGGCAIGRTLDENGRVQHAGAVYVADASAFPAVPHTGPHLPTIVQAERLVHRWCANATA